MTPAERAHALKPLKELHRQARDMRGVSHAVLTDPEDMNKAVTVQLVLLHSRLWELEAAIIRATEAVEAQWRGEAPVLPLWMPGSKMQAAE